MTTDPGDPADPPDSGNEDARSVADAADLYRRLVAFLPDLLAAPADSPVRAADELGSSREGRTIQGWRLGEGPRRVSLVGGCHADEPVGPRLLRKLVVALSDLDAAHPLRRSFSWWILPHLNPDGEARNRAWHDEAPEGISYEFVDFVRGVEREPPGEDVEFGFPRGEGDDGARPENRAAWRWWRSAEAPFRLHASLHGMALGGGPWYLLEAAWADRCGRLMERCRRSTDRLGYRLHDDPRQGEKGFRRLARGFSTRPDSRAMREHFREKGDEETARLFRPSSMETIRALGDDPLTLVSEMPLFLAPVDPGEAAPGQPAYGPWKERIVAWRRALASGEAGPEEVAAAAREAGIRPMPVEDQMRLQWRFVAAGVEQVEAERGPPAGG